EISGYRDAEEHRKGIRVCPPVLMKSLTELIQQPSQILPGADGADWAGKNIVNHEGRYGEFGDSGANAVLDNNVDAAANEHATAFKVDRADRIAEEHHGNNHPRGRLADRLLRDPSDVVHGGREVVEHDRGCAP